MSQIINFSTLQLLTAVDIYDQFFIRLNNGLSGLNGYGRATYDTVFSNLSVSAASNDTVLTSNSANWNSVFSTVQTNSAEWSTFTPTSNSATSLTLAVSNNHDVIYCTSASPNLVIVPPSLGNDFECTIIQNGIGQTTISASSGASLQSFGNLTKLAGQYARAHIVASVVADEYNLTGTLVS